MMPLLILLESSMPLKSNDEKVFMRGKLMPFDVTSINKFYGLQPLPTNDYFRFRTNPDVDQVIDLLINKQGVGRRSFEDEVTNFPTF